MDVSLNADRADQDRSATDPAAHYVEDMQIERPENWIATWLVPPRRTAVQTLVWYAMVVFASWFVPMAVSTRSYWTSWEITAPGGRSSGEPLRWSEPVFEAVIWIVLAVVTALLIVSGWLVSRSTRTKPIRTARMKLPWITGVALGLMLANLFVLAMRGVGMMMSVKVVLIIDAILVPLIFAIAVGSLARIVKEPEGQSPASSNPA